MVNESNEQDNFIEISILQQLRENNLQSPTAQRNK
jgi:hypothetical protein